MKLHIKNFMTTLGILFSFLLLSAFSFAKDQKIQGTIPVKNEEKSQYAALAKISIQDAMTRASKAAPGKIIEIVLEEEDGFLIYEAEVIGEDKSRKEVVIDAGTGAVLLIKNKKH